MIVVSDTSPIRALDYLGLLPILHELFDQVLIPPAVRDELTLPLPKFAAVELSRYDFVEVRNPQDQDRLTQLLRTLDRGEAEALTLALERHSPLILIDELKGRRVAAELGIVPLGAIGVLLRAKSRGLITEIRPHIEKLDELRFFMSAALKTNALRMAGE